jgi:hypothetical protein
MTWWKFGRPKRSAGALASLPLLDFASGMGTHFTYDGGFLVPTHGGMDYVNVARIAYATDTTMWFHDGFYVTEMSMPTPVVNADPTAMTRATAVQSYTDFYTPAFADAGNPANGFVLGGMLNDGSDLIMTYYRQYDASNDLEKCIWRMSRTLNTANFPGGGADVLWAGDANFSNNTAAFVGEYLSGIPAEYQSVFGGDAFCGSGNAKSIVTNHSFGPTALVFNRADVNVASEPLPATPLLYYPSGHLTLGAYDSTSPLWGANAMASEPCIIPGSRTMLFLGSNGLGDYCYGPPTADPELEGVLGEGQSYPYCYDPLSGAQAPHSYPYRGQYWAYDLNDLVLSKAGSIPAYQPVPYAYGEVVLPLTGNGSTNIYGPTFYPASGKL